MKISKKPAIIVSAIVTVVLGGAVAYGVSAVQGPIEVTPEVGGPAEVTVEASPETVEPGVVVQETQPEAVSEPQPSVSSPQPVANTVETPAPVVEVPQEQPQPAEPEFVAQPWMGDMSTSSRPPAEFPQKTTE